MSILGTKKSGEESEPGPAAGLSIIAVGMTVSGGLDSNGTVKVEGAVEGHVHCRAQVLVAKGGAVRGDVEAREAVIGGRVEGSIRAAERVEIQSGAAVAGDITTRRILVAEGAELNGRVKMGENLPAGSEGTSAGGASAMQQAGRQSVPVARVAVPPRLPTSGNPT